ncbi:hypothetical protein MN608_00067 [Microdochium nivale]|nr:hypothetical protein MN608_00067 [Microdochium nivale]
MFRWYRDAAMCYVYLADVTEATGPEYHASREIAIRTSRYFTRGWTLQELIAPKSVRLFSAHAEPLGDKASLRELLHAVTGIPTAVLEGAHPSSFSINDRFTWLGSRQTKRPEDRAYCMFGIFEVHLPLIYGEGEQHALDRLQYGMKSAATQ